MSASASKNISLTPGKRVLYLTKDLDLIRQQLYEGLNLKMADLEVADLMDDVNTDVMTPIWTMFDHDPDALADNAYAGLLYKGKQVFKPRALKDGNFEVIVSGQRKGTGSSRETAVWGERWSGIRIAVASSFAPIHRGNNISMGQLMCDHAMLLRLEAGESIALSEFTEQYDAFSKIILEHGGLLPFARAVAEKKVGLPLNQTGTRAMTLVEKILASHMLNAGPNGAFVKPGDAVLCNVDGGYSYEFFSPPVHVFLSEEFGPDYQVKNKDKLAVFEDHLVFAHQVPRFKPFIDKIQTLRDVQKEFQRHTGVRDYSAVDGVSPGICHQVAREEFISPGEFFLATDSHTCMGGGNNALAYGIGATDFAALAWGGYALATVPETIRFELTGALDPGCTAKDIMLRILATHARNEDTLGRAMEFGGPGLASLSPDERSTLCNMATECSARTGIVEGDDALAQWLADARGTDIDTIKASFVAPDADAHYAGGVHTINLSEIRPMVAHPGDPDRGIPSDPTNGALITEIGEVSIDIAYGGSCTAGKVDDFRYYLQVCEEADRAGLKVKDGVDFYIQYGSQNVRDFAQAQGWTELFERTGVKLVEPGCGACMGGGPGVSESAEQITVSAINRNFQGRSGPGQLYLASPLTVAARAFAGHIVAYREGMFSNQ